jgi:glucokinase
MNTAIGIDFGGTTIKCAVVERGTIRERGTTFETVKNDAQSLTDALVSEVRRMTASHPDIATVGIGLPGIVDSRRGIVHQLSNVPGWNDVPLRELMRQQTGLPAVLENDANAMAYGEWKFGAAIGARNVVCVTLGTGVGGGLILNGDLYRGSNLGAGEVGQMSIEINGPPGNYGNFGALEKYVGNLQIAERARQAYSRGNRHLSVEECSPLALAMAAEGGDEIARYLWVQFGTEIGTALASVVWLLNPDCIVIGGGVANAGKLLFEPILRTVRERTMPVFFESLRIVPAQLGNDAGIIGAAQLALDALPSFSAASVR